MKAFGFGQFWFFDNLKVHSAAVRPSRRATALKKSSRFTRSLPESSAVMPTSRKMTWGLDLKSPLFECLVWTRTRIFPGCISAWMKLSTWIKMTVQVNYRKKVTLKCNKMLNNHKESLNGSKIHNILSRKKKVNAWFNWDLDPRPWKKINKVSSNKKELCWLLPSRIKVFFQNTSSNSFELKKEILQVGTQKHKLDEVLIVSPMQFPLTLIVFIGLHVKLECRSNMHRQKIL